VASWASTPEDEYRPANARSDSLHMPTFRAAFKGKRCLVPADGFYEWQAVGRKKLIVHSRMADESALGLAGLWELWTDGTNRLATVCLITIEVNEVVAPLHDRMPVIISPEEHQEWLDSDTPDAELGGLLRPYPAAAMEARPGNPIMNKATVEGQSASSRLAQAFPDRVLRPSPVIEMVSIDMRSPSRKTVVTCVACGAVSVRPNSRCRSDQLCG